MASRGNPDMNKYLGNDVIIETSLNKFFSGTFKGFDEHMNIVMDKLVELDKDKKPKADSIVFPTAVIRGQAVVHVQSRDAIDRK
eukprot:UN01780